MYKVKFLNKNNEQYDFCEISLHEKDSFFDKLEEILYIMQELTPIGNNWKYELATFGQCLFSYHGLDRVEIRYNGNTREIYIKDVE